MSMNQEEKNEQNSMKWLSIAAGTAFLISLIGLLALMTQGAWAADAPPKPGFQSGTKTFANPFGNGGTAGAEANGDDDDDDNDVSDANFNTNSMNRPGGINAPGGFQANNSFANPNNGSGTGRGLPMGGTPDGGVVSGNNSPAISVDSETGDGSRELVDNFNFPDADIMDIAKTLGRYTGKNFIFDKDVKGRISVISNSKISVGDAWRAFLTALDMSGFALIPSGKYLRIARNRDARDKQLKTYTGDFSPDTDALVTRIFVLKYINADEVARTFRSFMPANSRIMAYDQTNTVIVTDTGANIGKLAKMLEILDIEGYDAGIEVIPVKYASAVELAKLIDQLIPGTGAGATGGIPRFGSSAGGHFTARRTKEGGIINTIIADDRTNNIIVHANTKGADQVRELVAKLDKNKPTSGGGGKVHVMYLQFADAEAIATTLNNLTSQSGSGFKPPTAGGTGVNPVGQSLFEGGIKVSPDKATNALVVTASPGDFVTVERVIARLDIPRDEVYVECVIMEVQLNRENKFSSSIISPASGIGSTPNSDLFTLLQNPAAATGAVLGFKSGNQSSITFGNNQTVSVSSVDGLITAIQTNTNSNVLATPQIIALDNTEANFESSENIPLLTSTAVPNAGVAQSITKERIALSMKIKPQINKLSNFVKLDVETKIGDIENRTLPSAVASQAFATLDRTAKTTVVVADEDTVVIGGLIRDNISDTVAKIPLLGDIPLIGWLFKATDHTVQKTNLLVFLTPHIVRQYEKVRALLDQKLKERDDYIERNAGGEDPMRYQRDNMIRSLPDLKTITANRPQTTVSIDSSEDQPAATEVVNPSNPFTGGESPNQPSTGNKAPDMGNPPAPPAMNP
jgi:general secretion pathway protein D